MKRSRYLNNWSTWQASRHTGNSNRVALQGANLDHDPANPCPQLKAMCPACHSRYDIHSGQRRGWLVLEMLKQQ